ncbi:MAG: CoA pyrophosphatase, partial [Clostridia bacterium]|nr:CoA pyrophosphatase [Clostridia bacterium]
MRCLSAVLQERQPRLFGLNELVEAAVLVPLVQDDGGRWHLLFEVRSPDLRSRPSEICFPGGHVEPTDHTPAEAAVRETCEELQLPADAVQVLGAL